MHQVCVLIVHAGECQVSEFHQEVIKSGTALFKKPAVDIADNVAEIVNIYNFTHQHLFAFIKDGAGLRQLLRRIKAAADHFRQTSVIQVYCHRSKDISRREPDLIIKAVVESYFINGLRFYVIENQAEQSIVGGDKVMSIGFV